MVVPALGLVGILLVFNLTHVFDVVIAVFNSGSYYNGGIHCRFSVGVGYAIGLVRVKNEFCQVE
ncbi:MAG: hypothetical protein ABIN74_14750 [Ferruginibacter sp.]